MARTTTNVTWASNASTTVTAGTGPVVDTSDAITPGASAYEAGLSVSVTHSGTPASGDTLDVWLELSSDGTNFDSEQQAQLYYLGVIDTADALTDGTSPGASFTARKSFAHLPLAFGSWKLHVKNNSGTSGVGMTVSAVYTELS